MKSAASYGLSPYAVFIQKVRSLKGCHFLLGKSGTDILNVGHSTFDMELSTSSLLDNLLNERGKRQRET